MSQDIVLWFLSIAFAFYSGFQFAKRKPKTDIALAAEKEVRSLSFKPGDVVFLQVVNQAITTEIAESFKSRLDAMETGIKFVILDNTVKVVGGA